MNSYTEEDVIYINDNVLNDTYQIYNRLSDDFSMLSGDISNAGDINVQTGLFGDGMNKLSKQSTSISSRFYSISSIVYNSIDEWIMLEKKLTNEANSIPIPRIEKLTQSVVNYMYINVNISKNDGISVRNGQESNKSENNDNSIIEEEKLKNIKKDETKSQIYDDEYNYNNENRIILENIEKDETALQTYDDKYRYNNENRKKLENIKKDGTVLQTYDDKYNYNNENRKILENIEKDETALQIYDDKYNYNYENRKKLENIEKDGTVLQTYDDKYNYNYENKQILKDDIKDKTELYENDIKR